MVQDNSKPTSGKSFKVKTSKTLPPIAASSLKSPYDAEFVKKINIGEAERKAGKEGQIVDPKNLWK